MDPKIRRHRQSDTGTNGTRRRKILASSSSTIEIGHPSDDDCYYSNNYTNNNDNNQSDSDKNDDDYMYNYNNTKTAIEMYEKYDNNDNKEKKKKKRIKDSKRKKNTDSRWYIEIKDEIMSDPSFFLCLFIRVATALGFICFVIYSSYIRFYPPKGSTQNIYNDDDDTASPWNNNNSNNNNNPPVALNNQQQQHPNDVATDHHLTHKILNDLYQEDIEDEKNEEEHHPKTIPPLPTWNLSNYALDWDPYSIFKNILSDDSNNQNSNEFWKEIYMLLSEFTDLYGGENSARAILDRGITTFGKVQYNNNNDESDNKKKRQSIPDDLQQTSCRILNSIQNNNSDFLLSFGGYSVTAGRGNYFHQAYPFVLEEQLRTLTASLVSLSNTTTIKSSNFTLKVRNAAIGGCSSFPYGWCLRNFLGDTSNVISWDFSMNEAGAGIDPAAGFEAYIRHALSLTTTSQPPKIIVKDTHMATERKAVLQYYYNYYLTQRLADNSTSSVYFDPVIIHTDPAVRPFLEELGLDEENRPRGFQDWRKFGSPPGAPGQSLHHPAVAEHEFIAWLLSMHFLPAFQLVAINLDPTKISQYPQYTLHCQHDNPSRDDVLLPPPIYKNAWNKTEPWWSILYGKPISKNNEKSEWKMNPVHCRTTYEPIIANVVNEISPDTIVAAGSIGEDLGLMLPKSNMYYNRGWVLDIGDEEKKVKRVLERFGGLGFIDTKKAYYGIVTSGTLQLLLPYEPTSTNNKLPKPDDKANEWFKSVVVCEVNEKRDTPSACEMERDIQFTVGGINVTTKLQVNTTEPTVPILASSMSASGTMYLGKRLCMHLQIPDDAKLTTRREIAIKDPKFSNFIFPEDMMKKMMNNTAVGLPLSLTVINKHIIKREQACSISHVIWEQVS